MYKTRPISLRQEKFCMEYMFDLNASRAVVQAGYKATNARASATTLLRNPAVKARIEELQEELRNTYRITNEKVIRELALVAFSDIGHYLTEDNEPVDITKLPPDKRRAVVSIRTYNPDAQGKRPRASLKLHDKIKVLELLCKHLGLLKEGMMQQDCVNQIIVIPDSMSDETLQKHVEDIKQGNYPANCEVISPFENGIGKEEEGGV